MRLFRACSELVRCDPALASLSEGILATGVRGPWFVRGPGRSATLTQRRRPAAAARASPPAAGGARPALQHPSLQPAQL